jgi:hypothetical protein
MLLGAQFGNVVDDVKAGVQQFVGTASSVAKTTSAAHGEL